MIQPCQNCLKRPAAFFSKGRKGNSRHHGDAKHDLCRQCFQSQTESVKQRERAELLAGIPQRNGINC